MTRTEALAIPPPTDTRGHVREWIRIQAAAPDAMVAMYDAALADERRMEARRIRALCIQRDPLGRGWVSREELMEILASEASR